MFIARVIKLTRVLLTVSENRGTVRHEFVVSRCHDALATPAFFMNRHSLRQLLLGNLVSSCVSLFICFVAQEKVLYFSYIHIICPCLLK